MTEKERLQLIESRMLKWKDCGTINTSWKEALKSELGRKAKGRKLVFSRHARAGLLTMILDRMKRSR